MPIPVVPHTEIKQTPAAKTRTRFPVVTRAGRASQDVETLQRRRSLPSLLSIGAR